MFYGGRHNGGITPDLRYESVGRGFESLPSHQKNAVRSKDFMAFLFFATQLHGFCTVGARFVFSVLNYVGRGIALQSVPFFAFKSTVQGEAVPSFQGLHFSGAPKARP